MARRKIKIMISSRCNDLFPAGGGKGSCTFSEIRARLKTEIEAEKLFGKEAFEVWINEDEPPEPGAQDSWDLCVEQARETDLLLVLYNGNAGWAVSAGDIGICHAELMTAFSESSGKVSIVSMLDSDPNLRPSGPRDRPMLNAPTCFEEPAYPRPMTCWRKQKSPFVRRFSTWSITAPERSNEAGTTPVLRWIGRAWISQPANPRCEPSLLTLWRRGALRLATALSFLSRARRCSFSRPQSPRP